MYPRGEQIWWGRLTTLYRNLLAGNADSSLSVTAGQAARRRWGTARKEKKDLDYPFIAAFIADVLSTSLYSAEVVKHTLAPLYQNL
jgi:hypothetical protein